jgi:hypothetical protein
MDRWRKSHQIAEYLEDALLSSMRDSAIVPASRAEGAVEVPCGVGGVAGEDCENASDGKLAIERMKRNIRARMATV